MNTDFNDVPWGLLAPIIILNLILVIVALIDYGKQAKTKGAHPFWIPLILFVSFIGPVEFNFGHRRAHRLWETSKDERRASVLDSADFVC